MKLPRHSTLPNPMPSLQKDKEISERQMLRKRVSHVTKEDKKISERQILRKRVSSCAERHGKGDALYHLCHDNCNYHREKR